MCLSVAEQIGNITENKYIINKKIKEDCFLNEYVNFIYFSIPDDIVYFIFSELILVLNASQWLSFVWFISIITLRIIIEIWIIIMIKLDGDWIYKYIIWMINFI